MDKNPKAKVVKTAITLSVFFCLVGCDTSTTTSGTSVANFPALQVLIIANSCDLYRDWLDLNSDIEYDTQTTICVSDSDQKRALCERANNAANLLLPFVSQTFAKAAVSQQVYLKEPLSTYEALNRLADNNKASIVSFQWNNEAGVGLMFANSPACIARVRIAGLWEGSDYDRTFNTDVGSFMILESGTDRDVISFGAAI
jgi:hypothetical protein